MDFRRVGFLRMRKSDSIKKRLIMTRAEELIANGGFQNTTISQIARACNISEAGLYEYFKNKEDLLFSIPEKHFQDLLRGLQEHLLGIYGVENKVRKLIWHYLLFMQERSQFARLFMLEIWSNQRYYKSEKSDTLLKYWMFVHNILKEARDEGIFRKNLDILVFECMIYGTINHYILTSLVFDRPLKLIEKGEMLEWLFMDAMNGYATERDALWEVGGKKRAILQAALEEFDKEGYLQTPISQICSRAGITEPTLYEYFNSKEDILLAIPELAMDKFLTNLKEHIVRNDQPESKLKLFLWNQMDSYETYPDYYRVLLSELHCSTKFYQSSAYTVGRKYAQEFLAILQSGVDTGIFRKDINLNMIQHVYLGMLDQLLIYSVVRKNELKISEKTSQIYDIIMHMVRVPSGQH